MLDQFLPHPRLIELDHADVAVPPARAYEVARHFDATRSPLVRALFALRTVPDRLTGRAHETPSLCVDDIGKKQPGFRVLADEPGVGFAVGAIGRFWELEIPFADVAPEAFASFREPGFAKVAWAMRFEPLGESSTRIVFELRLDATDEEAWKSVRRYFHVIGPFSHFIRRHALAMLRADLGTPEDAEQTDPLPGDELLHDAKAQVTHGVTIKASPEAIWPWLVQMGCHRAGWYSYDRLDNGGVPSAREIVPELQKIAVGDMLPASPEGEGGFEVLRVDPGRVLVLGGLYGADKQVPFEDPRPESYWQATWAFVLEPLGPNETRLHVRARVSFAPDSMKWKAAWMRRVHDFMTSHQLHNLERRAEGRMPRAHSTLRDVGDGVVGALGILLDIATPFLRGMRSHWGLDEEEANRRYPGDDLLQSPTWGWTHAVEIDSPAERVWPWIAQVGQDKGGFYSYQWLENLAGCEIQNADRVHAEWTHPKVGDALKVHPKAPAMRIAAVEPGRFLVAFSGTDQSAGAPPKGDPRVAVTWLFLLEPIGEGRCRFISRYRAACGDRLADHLMFGPTLIEPVGFAMDRRMLLGVKERAEKAR